ncbi:MAG: AEC family transporter [Lachnospiraceae bacterium]|nr:AEC family transporter [Lachnospiraceae bacterium]
MLDVLTRAGCFIMIIVAGYVLRRVNFFKEGDFTVLSKITLKITLPAAFVSNFSGKQLDPSMLSFSLMALGAGILYMILGYTVNMRKEREDRAFGVLNLPGYNIGNFTLPFLQSFLGPAGVITASLFDAGNAFVCLGGAFGVASSIRGTGKFSIKRVLKALSRSVAFLTCITMMTLGMLGITLPGAVIQLADIVGGANAFIAMLMLGVGFKFSGEKSQIGMIVRLLAARYGVALVLATVFYHLPLDQEVRTALMVLAFSPISSSVPAFTEEMGGDAGLSAAVNSMSIICSMVFMISILMVML